MTAIANPPTEAPAKPNCFKCQYRGNIPGDAHSRCLHPSIGEQDSDPFVAMMQVMAGGGQAKEASRELHITANEIGVRGGWFIWPVNFDPVWLLTCEGFKEK